MKIKDVNLILNDSTMQNKECNFKLTHKGQSKFDLIIERLDKLENKLEKSINSINSRIDNLVRMNHLKE